MPFGQIEQQPGQSLRTGGAGAATENRVRVVELLRHHAAVSAIGSLVSVQERAELVVRHDQRTHLADGPDRGVTPSGGLARGLPDDVVVAAQREHDLLSVLGRGEDLDPSGQQDEHMRGRVALEAERRADGIVPGQPKGRQGVPFSS